MKKSEILHKLSNNSDHFSIFDIGSDGGLKGGPLNEISILPKVSTISFEPSSSRMYDSVDEWMTTENIHNINSNINVPFLVGSHERKHKKFYITKKAQCSSCLEPDIDSISKYHYPERFQVEDIKSFPMTTIDKVIQMLNLKLGLIKLDIQGYELEVLKGAINSIQKFKPWIILEMNTMPLYHNQASVGSLSSFLESHNYKLKRVYPVNLNLMNKEKSPKILTFFDGLWCPEISNDQDLLIRDLILQFVFGFHFTREFGDLLTRAYDHAYLKIIQDYNNSIIRGEEEFEDHIP